MKCVFMATGLAGGHNHSKGIYSSFNLSPTVTAISLSEARCNLFWIGESFLVSVKVCRAGHCIFSGSCSRAFTHYMYFPIFAIHSIISCVWSRAILFWFRSGSYSYLVLFWLGLGSYSCFALWLGIWIYNSFVCRFKIVTLGCFAVRFGCLSLN